MTLQGFASMIEEKYNVYITQIDEDAVTLEEGDLGTLTFFTDSEVNYPIDPYEPWKTKKENEDVKLGNLDIIRFYVTTCEPGSGKNIKKALKK